MVLHNGGYPRYDYVLFDADNTLFDFDAAERAAVRISFAAWGFSYTPETEALYFSINRPLWDAYGRGEVTQQWLTVERFRRLNAELGGTGNPAAMNEFYLARLAEGAILYPDSLPLVERLVRHCTLAIVTNGVASVQEGRFGRSPITPYMRGVFISQSLGCQKPEARFFDLVCASLGIADRTRAVVVGDTPETDIQGGINAGIDTVWFNPRGKQSAVVPTRTVTTLPQIASLILGDGQEVRPLGGEST